MMTPHECTVRKCICMRYQWDYLPHVLASDPPTACKCGHPTYQHRFRDQESPMAMGQESRRQAISAFDNHREWSLSTGSLRGTTGGKRELGWLSSESNAAELKASLREATYVVYSYDTPIGWALEDENTGLMERVIPAVNHSATTNIHRGALRDAWESSYHDGTAKGREKWLRDHRAAWENSADAMTSGSRS